MKKELINIEQFIDTKYEKLELFVATLLKWNEKINLVAKASEEEIWNRHILDSAQLLKFIPNTKAKIVDLGSGAGFPGLVLAIMGYENVTLIESDNKKSVFLQEAARITGTKVQIINERIEKVNLPTQDVATARALSDLTSLLNLAEPFLGENSQCLFLKGKKLKEELEVSKKFWQVTETIYESIVKPEDASDRGFVLQLNKVSKING